MRAASSDVPEARPIWTQKFVLGLCGGEQGRLSTGNWLNHQPPTPTPSTTRDGATDGPARGMRRPGLDAKAEQRPKQIAAPARTMGAACDASQEKEQPRRASTWPPPAQRWPWVYFAYCGPSSASSKGVVERGRRVEQSCREQCAKRTTLCQSSGVQAFIQRACFRRYVKTVFEQAFLRECA